MQSGALGGHRFPLSQKKLLWKCAQLIQPVSFKHLQGWGEYYPKKECSRKGTPYLLPCRNGFLNSHLCVTQLLDLFEE